MASDKKKNYSTEGLNSRQEVQDALASAGYQPSEQVTEAEAALKAQQSAAPGDYQSRYQDQIDRTLNDLNARRAFHYNYAQDPLYQQYAQAYTQNAHNASADAAAQAAALTGGYGSSYAASVAQQAYQQQIGALNQAIPTLYQLALDTYDSGNAYNTAYQQDYGQYQDYLSRLDTLYGNYAAQEQEAAAQKQQRFNNAVTVLGLIGDAVQIALSGTTGLGSLAGSLVNTGYNIYANNRAYEADRADTAWNQQMQEKQVQNAQAQQKYDNDFAQQQYQDKLRQQQFNNQVTSEKLNIAKGEWALKQSKAAQQAQKASAAAAQRAAAAGASGTSGPGSGNLNVGKSGVLGSTAVPYTAARLRSQGRSDAAIRTELLKEGYSSKEVGEIMKQLNS